MIKQEGSFKQFILE